MSIQRNLKKGFTLIELMVVIVIIGILAAVAIPKLFGMSAKAKAQEVGGVVGTWGKLQMAYKMETGNWGGATKISFKLPGETPTEATSTTGNFIYSVDAELTTEAIDSPTIEGESKFSADGCSQGAVWSGKFESIDDEDVTTTISGGADCEALTPNFLKIGTGRNAKK